MTWEEKDGGKWCNYIVMNNNNKKKTKMLLNEIKIILFLTLYFCNKTFQCHVKLSGAMCSKIRSGGSEPPPGAQPEGEACPGGL